MKRWLAAACALALTSCGSFMGTVPGVPSRETVGVGVHDPAGAAADKPSADVAEKLDWKTNQLCTRGYTISKEEAVPAENGGKIADRLVTCQPYGFSVLGVSFAGLVPF